MEATQKKNKYEIDMCNGTIMDKLISFALPLMVSSILQLLFNAVDIIVVGRFTGSQALAAVGSTTALINMFVNLFIGVSLGANVLSARFYAAGKEQEMSGTVHTAMTFALISGVVMVFVGLFCTRGALELMDTPVDVIDQAALYMKIYFCGMPFFMLYNYGAAILRAVGDTKRPLLFLIISGAINAVLNLFLVIAFSMGVAGVAIATVISQVISCVLVLWCLFTTDSCYRLQISKLGIKGEYLLQIFQVGVPAGIQSVVINFSNVLLQSSVNSFGSIAMAGYTAANNIFGFLFVSVNSVTQACMSFTSQNYGAGKKKRMDRVLIDCMMLGTVFCNLCPQSADLMKAADKWTSPLFALFFVISGAELELGVFTDWAIVCIGLVYILFRSAGKYIGAFASSKYMKCGPEICKYLGITLLPQAGVALGMCTTAMQLGEQGGLIRNITLFSVLIYEMVGPLLTRQALMAAGDIQPLSAEACQRRPARVRSAKRSRA